MVFPIVFFPSILPSDGDTETNTVLGLVDAYHIPTHFAENSGVSEGTTAMSIPDDATNHLIATQGAISATTKSLLNLRTGSAYQVGTTGSLKLVVKVINASGPANVTFKVWKSTSLDSATGTTVYDFTNSTDLDSGEAVTTPVLVFTVNTNDYINIQTTASSGISGVKAWIVEFPTP